MIINGKECVFLQLRGEGSYSGSVASHCMFLSKSFYGEHKELIEEHTPYFGELDGKHSDVEGTVEVFEEADEQLARAYDEWEGDTWMIVESLFDFLQEESEEDYLHMIQFHEEISHSVKVVTERTFIYGNQAFQF